MTRRLKMVGEGGPAQTVYTIFHENGISTINPQHWRPDELRKIANHMDGKSSDDGWAAHTRLQDQTWANFETWFKIIDFHGLTPIQPECAIIIDEALRISVQMKRALRMLVEAKDLKDQLDQHPKGGTASAKKRYRLLKAEAWAAARALTTLKDHHGRP